MIIRDSQKVESFDYKSSLFNDKITINKRNLNDNQATELTKFYAIATKSKIFPTKN